MLNCVNGDQWRSMEPPTAVICWLRMAMPSYVCPPGEGRLRDLQLVEIMIQRRIFTQWDWHVYKKLSIEKQNKASLQMSTV